MSTKENKKIHSSGNEAEMSFLDHLEELRWRIIYSAIGVVVATVIAWIFIDYIVSGILLIPAKQFHIKLQNIRPFGQIMLYFEIAVIAGCILSLPNILYQLWKFISPALRQSERKYISSIVVFSSLSFIIGIVFAYYVMIPLCMIFAAQFGSTVIENNFAVDEYFSIIISIMLACGLVFELPMVSFFLSKLGILHPKFMRRYRRHAIIFIVIAAGILTPGTDPVSQIALAIPLVLLYEISIFVSKLSQKEKVSKVSLSNIALPVQEELGCFNDIYKKSMKSDVSLVDLITKFILKQKGKKIRPLLVLLSSKAAGGINERSYRGAVLVELLHSATLVHDDIVDNADKRRGLPSINAIWKNKIAVLMGDYLLSRGLLVAVENGDVDLLRVITNAVKRMSEGELLQIYKARKLDIDVDTYYRIISDKTAALLSTCCQIGALSATDNQEYQETLRKFGETIGIAFQIKDDILDYVGSSSIIGKPSGGDIKEKKITLPLIHALKQAPKNESAAIVKTIRKGAKKRDVGEVINFVNKYGGITFAENAAHEYAEKAKRLLDILPPSESRSALELLVDFIVERTK